MINTDKFAEMARQDILDAIYNYMRYYGDFRLVVYKDCDPFHADITAIRAGKDCVKIEFDANDFD